MGNCLIQKADGLHTGSEAVAFVAYAVKKSITGKEYVRYTTCIFAEGKVTTNSERHPMAVVTSPVKMMENAVETGVIEYCRQHRIKSVDVVYDMDEEIFADRRETWDKAIESIVQAEGRMLYETKSADIEVWLYREKAQGIDSHRLIQSLRWCQDTKWLNALSTIGVFLTLTQKMADKDVLSEGEDSDVNLTALINEAAYWKTIVMEPQEEAADELWNQEAWEGEVPEDVWEDVGSGSGRQKNIIDLIFRYAESIKKEKLTYFHLLYAYACISQMSVADICEELGMGEAAYASISYLQGRINEIFNHDKVQIDPVNLKHMIVEQVDILEKDTVAIEEYEKAEKELKDRGELEVFSPEMIAYKVLNHMMFDGESYQINRINNVYLRNNKKIMLETKKKPLADESLEKIAGISGRLYDALAKKVVGQEAAIRKFVQGYVNARLAGAFRKDKPAATYLFAGPPGVGKTYLARLAARTLKLPFKIFDMSEYSGPNALEGLVGFEKTWKQAVPGILTTFVSENPSAILLFDEIEKAHITVQMLFLQILEGARLFDKYYAKEVSFENVIVIFTTNCGKSLYQDNEDADLSELSDGEVFDALQEDEDFPSEMCSRFASGNIVMFNHLKRQYLCDIVRSKMNETAEDIYANYWYELKYDKLLPELFLFHVGSSVDARVASIRSAEFLNDCMISFAKDAVAKHEVMDVEEVSVEIELKKENRDIYTLFVNEQSSNILVISDSEKIRQIHTDMHVLFAADEHEAVRLIRENKIMYAIIDLTYKAAERDVFVSNALGIESVGRSCMNLILEKAPQIPVYIVDQETYHTEDKKEILAAGASGIFEEGEDTQTCLVNMEELAGQLYIQNNLKRLSKKRQNVDYKMRFFTREKTGVVELYDLNLRNAGMNDSSLRRKAKMSKVFDFERPKLHFDEIIGAETAKRDLKHFISYMHNIDKYVLEGAEIPRGVLLYGLPGTGKTSLAKALAGECDALFLNTTGASIRNAADPVQEIKDLFQIAYANAPAILFIDEIDVIAKQRNGHDTALEMLVNTLLTEMEGFGDKDPFKPVFVVAATNYNVTRSSGDPYEVVIDPALVRRFDNPVYVGLPSREERKKYIQRLLEQKHYTDKISETAVNYVAEHTGGKSFAFLRRAISNMTNAAIDMEKEINDELLTDTLETQLYGEKRENTEEYRLSVARHEAGHAYVGFQTGRTPKFITIASRGDFGGYVSYGDGEEINNLTKTDFLNCICQGLAGRAAEIVYYGEQGINTGAGSDLKKATSYAIKMICDFGMGNLGLLSLDPDGILNSPKGAEVLEEANRILDEQMQRAIALVKEGRDVIDRVVSELMDKSYIQGEILNVILTENAKEQDM